MTTHAPLRSQWAKALSVCHVRGLGDGDAPTSPTKDTRLLAVACRPMLGPYTAAQPSNGKELDPNPRYTSWKQRVV